MLGLEVDEAQDLWEEYYSDKTIARDNKGFRGSERLWLPLHEMQSREREHYVDNRVVEGSGDIKAPSMTERFWRTDVTLLWSLVLVTCCSFVLNIET